MFGSSDRVSEWRIHDHDAARRGRRDIDVVDAYAGAPDHLELHGGADHILIRFRCGAHRQAVVLADDIQKIGFLEAYAYIRLYPAAAKDLERLWAQLIGN